MADNEFSLGNKRFKLSKVSALKQFHLVRRISPMLNEMLPVLKNVSVKSVESASESDKLDAMAKFMAPIMDGMSRMSDADSELVLLRLLESVEMQQDKGWAKIAHDVGGSPVLMFQDIELPILLYAAGRAFMYNLTSFFAVLQHLS